MIPRGTISSRGCPPSWLPSGLGQSCAITYYVAWRQKPATVSCRLARLFLHVCHTCHMDSRCRRVCLNILCAELCTLDFKSCAPWDTQCSIPECGCYEAICPCRGWLAVARGNSCLSLGPIAGLPVGRREKSSQEQGQDGEVPGMASGLSDVSLAAGRATRGNSRGLLSATISLGCLFWIPR